MATTQLKDIFVADYYQAIAPVNSPEKTAVYKSGIVTRNAALDKVAQLGQGTATVSYWQDLDADEAPNASTDNPDEIGKVGKVTQGSMTSRTLYLNKGYGVTDLASELADSAPMEQVRNRFGTYWERQWQRYTIGAARGVIASNIAKDNSDMVIDLGDKAVAASAFQDAAFTAGDSADQFKAIGVHSAVMNQMVKQNLIEYLKDSEGNVILSTYLGRPIFMDDGLKTADNKFMSVFFGGGAFGYGVGSPEVPVELDRNAAGGNGGGAETLWERKTYILQPAGFSWIGEKDQNKTPSAIDYGNAANWERVFERKQVPFAAIISGTIGAPGGSGGLGD